MQFNEQATGVTRFDEGQFPSIAGQTGTLNSAAGQPGNYQYDLFVRGHTQSIERVGVEQQTVFLGSDFELSEGTTLWGQCCMAALQILLNRRHRSCRYWAWPCRSGLYDSVQ